MKATINSKTYNTETAEELACDSWSGSSSDFQHWHETLYRTAKGAHFLQGYGGPLSKYAESFGNERSGGSAIVPMTKEEALQWCEKHACQDVIDENFADIIEEA